MSSITRSDPTLISFSAPKSKKHKKRKGGAKGKPNGDSDQLNGVKNDEGIENNEPEEQEQEPETPTESSKSPIEDEAPPTSPGTRHEHPYTNGTSMVTNDVNTVASGLPDVEAAHSLFDQPDVTSTSLENLSIDKPSNENAQVPSIESPKARLDALASERTALRDEVAWLRRSLEQMQGKHEEELANVREHLEETQGEKEHAESQYRNLLGKVNTIKSTLGERLKADAEDLAEARKRIDDLEEQNENLRDQNEARVAEVGALAEEGEHRSKELSSLRNRTTLSQQNWSKERDDLIQREKFAREEFEAAKQAMQDWEVLAMEERSIREAIAEKVADLEEQVSNHREAHERAALERDTQSLTVDGLQRALQEIQDARRRELRELVENSQAQVESLRKQLQEVESKATEATESLESTKKELDRASPFEKEVKEKNLLIGKLRHEAVILNDHLTKALRYLKKGKPEDNIDKLLVTNHFLQFLALERADPKKFQILQVMAALLGWTDEQREQAGLARPGASNPNLRVPISPWHRTPSTPALSTEFFPESRNRKESLSDLWSDFLEQEAQEGAKSPTSVSSVIKPS